jgi:hypothetical protein
VPSNPREAIGPAKNKVRRSGKFSALKEAPSSHHDPPHNHHKSTSNLPSKKTHNFPNPLKNARKTAKNRTPPAPEFFCQIRTSKTISPPE